MLTFHTYDPAIDVDYFPNTESIGYWSSSPSAFGTSYAWDVDFYGGDDVLNYRANNKAVRLVRGTGE